MTELKSNTEWKQWGREDPFWGVASWANKHKSGASPWKEEEFYAVGESDFKDFLWHWQHYGVDLRSCLEIGCGAGRITRQLSRLFDSVRAVDVSEDMIKLARRAAEPNVEFSVVDGLRLPIADCSVNAIFSTHVLQHLDSTEIGFAYFREFFRVLAAGGTMMIHLPIYSFPYEKGAFAALMKALYAIARTISRIWAELRRLKGTRLMRGTPYPITRLTNILSEIGFRNIEFRVFPTKINGELHPFVFATK